MTISCFSASKAFRHIIIHLAGTGDILPYRK
jgi:hypothetical protein